MTVQLFAEEINLSKTLSILQQKHSHFATLVFLHHYENAAPMKLILWTHQAMSISGITW